MTAKRYVKVKFSSSYDASVSDSYVYEDKFKKPLEKHEAVLVPTRYGQALAIVTQVNVCSTEYYGTKLVVTERIKSKTLEAATKKERAREIEYKLEAKAQELDKINRFKAYADNPDMAELVKQLEELQ